MSDQPDKPEDGDSAPGEPPVPEPELLKAEEVRLSDPDVSDDAVEPTLSTSADEVRLTEPSLGAAEISDDAAEAASLDEAAAEAESVAREAENVGTLISGPRPANDPAEAAAPAGTAPAGGAAGDAAGDAAREPQESAEPTPLVAPNVPVPHDSAPEAATDGEGSDVAHGSSDASDAAETPAYDTAGQGLTSYAAGDAPTWIGQNADQSRWDELFEVGQSPAAGEPAHPDAPSDPDDTSEPETPPEAEKLEPEGPPSAAAPDAPWTSAAPDARWAAPTPPPSEHAPGMAASPVGGPYGLPPAGPDEAAPTRIRARSARSAPRRSNRKLLITLGVVGLAVLALLIFAIMNIVNALRSDDPGAEASSSTTPGADGIIAENISPLDLESGACVLGFDSADVSADVTTVTCTTPHNAQLLATTSLPDDADFPGEAALNASGDELCNSVPIDQNAAADFPNLTLTQVTPTTGTWADGDRRIDCFVVSDEGNVITDSLLAE